MVSKGFPNVFICCAKRRVASFTHVLVVDKPVHLPRFIRHIFSRQSFVLDVEGVKFRPRAVVVWREVVAGYTRISKKYVHEKEPLGECHTVAYRLMGRLPGRIAR